MIEVIERRRRARIKTLAITSTDEVPDIIDFAHPGLLSFDGEVEDEPGVWMWEWYRGEWEPPMRLRSDAGWYLIQRETAPGVYGYGEPAYQDQVTLIWEPVSEGDSL